MESFDLFSHQLYHEAVCSYVHVFPVHRDPVVSYKRNWDSVLYQSLSRKSRFSGKMVRLQELSKEYYPIS